MPRTLEDLDLKRARTFGKGGGGTSLTMAEQLLRERAERALALLEKAKKTDNPVLIAEAKVGVVRVSAELQRTNASRGSLATMQAALSRSMTGL